MHGGGVTLLDTGGIATCLVHVVFDPLENNWVCHYAMISSRSSSFSCVSVCVCGERDRQTDRQTEFVRSK